MFGKLKDTLKGALSVFSKKAEEESEEQEILVEQAVEEPKDETKKPEKEVAEREAVKKTEKKTTPAKKKEKKPQKEEKKEKTPEKEKREEKKETAKKKEKVTEVKEEKEEKQEQTRQQEKPEKKAVEIVSDVEVSDVEAEKPQEAEEKKGFFGRLFSRKKEEEKEKKTIEPKEKPSEEAVSEESEETKETKEVKEEKEKKEEVKEIKEQEPRKEEKKEKISEEKSSEKSEEKPAVESKGVVEEKEKTGFFGKIKKTLTTKTISADKFEELFWELELVLLENNVSVEVIERIKEDLKQELVDKPLPRDVLGKIQSTLQATLQDILSYEKTDLLKRIQQKKGSFVIAFFGINGAGKTTSIAKLAYYLQQQDLSVVLAACDTFRAAAIDQLQEHADRLQVKMIKHEYGSDAAAVAYDAIQYAQKNKIDVVLIDTAGRLHSNTNLMAELEKIIRVTKPDMKIFVGESITGNDCIEQARKFNELVEMDGAILTKADVDEKGGAPLSISYTIKKPILFLGVGQEYKDLEEFAAEKILGHLGF